MIAASQERYSTVAIALHWAIAALVIANVWLGWQLEEVARDGRAAIMGWHQPIGVSILVLTLARLAWRFAHRPPPLSSTLKPWERRLAKSVHILFYVLMIALPLTGWITVSARQGAGGIDMWGLVQVPALEPFASMARPLQHTVHEGFEETHHLLAKVVVYGLIPLHVLGALKHQFIDRQDAFWRMAPFLPRRGG